MFTRQKILLSIALLACTSGCANFDRISATSFEPLNNCKEGYQCFKYISYADAVFPEGDEKAEKYRLEMLRIWLKNNGLEYAKYKITSRKAVLTNHGLLGDVYKIYYEIQVFAQYSTTMQ